MECCAWVKGDRPLRRRWLARKRAERKPCQVQALAANPPYFKGLGSLFRRGVAGVCSPCPCGKTVWWVGMAHRGLGPQTPSCLQQDSPSTDADTQTSRAEHPEVSLCLHGRVRHGQGPWPLVSALCVSVSSVAHSAVPLSLLFCGDYRWLSHSFCVQLKHFIVLKNTERQ